MLAVLEILGEVVDAIASWRLYVCLGPALLGAYCLHSAVPDATWPWFVSVPVMITAFVLGVRWEWRACR
jgi:hypothetical protein